MFQQIYLDAFSLLWRYENNLFKQRVKCMYITGIIDVCSYKCFFPEQTIQRC